MQTLEQRKTPEPGRRGRRPEYPGMESFESTITSRAFPLPPEKVAKEAEKLLSTYPQTERDEVAWRIIRAIFGREKMRDIGAHTLRKLAEALRDNAPHVWEFYNKHGDQLYEERIVIAFLGPSEIPPEYRAPQE